LINLSALINLNVFSSKDADLFLINSMWYFMMLWRKFYFNRFYILLCMYVACDYLLLRIIAYNRLKTDTRKLQKSKLSDNLDRILSLILKKYLIQINNSRHCFTCETWRLKQNFYCTQSTRCICFLAYTATKVIDVVHTHIYIYIYVYVHRTPIVR